MFGKREAETPAAKSIGKERFATIIGERTAIKGDLDLSDSIRIDGHIEGNTRRRGEGAVTVVVGQSGKVTGDIHASRVVVAGTVLGGVHADEDVELQATALVEGDVQCRSLHVAHGARLTGRILTADAASAASASSVSKPVLVVDKDDQSDSAAQAKRA
jgi:cytoskeletal protein CcmA (bactofilin family)